MEEIVTSYATLNIVFYVFFLFVCLFVRLVWLVVFLYDSHQFFLEMGVDIFAMVAGWHRAVNSNAFLLEDRERMALILQRMATPFRKRKKLFPSSYPRNNPSRALRWIRRIPWKHLVEV